MLDPQATPLLKARTAHCGSLDDLLFVLMTMGDDRAVRATYLAGHKAYDRDGGFSYPAPRSGAPKPGP